MRRLLSKSSLLIGLSAFLLLQSCVNLKPRENDTRFYVLGAAAVAQQEVPADKGYVLGLRRIKLADYLDTPHIVVRVGANEVMFSDDHRWGEDLGPAINRVVAGFLSGSSSVHQVEVVPWATGVQPTYIVEIEVQKFEGTSPNPAYSRMDAHLQARWKVLNPATNNVLKQGTTDEMIDGPALSSYASLVSGLERVLGRLAKDLVDAVDTL